jgi:hypothetical protein
MNKINQEMNRAIRRQKNWKRGNTRIEVRPNKDVDIYVDTILVAKWECHTDLLRINGANPTRATASRLDALVGRFFMVHLQNGCLLLTKLDSQYKMVAQRLLYPTTLTTVLR